MLALTRHEGERVYLDVHLPGGERVRILVEVVEMCRHQRRVRLGFAAPQVVRIYREERAPEPGQHLTGLPRMTRRPYRSRMSGRSTTCSPPHSTTSITNNPQQRGES